MTQKIDWSSEDDHALAVTACCIWELLDNEPGPWNLWRDHNGVMELRSVACDLAVTAANFSRNLNDDEHYNAGAFDWEWLPAWLRMVVDWSDTTQPPRVK